MSKRGVSSLIAQSVFQTLLAWLDLVQSSLEIIMMAIFLKSYQTLHIRPVSGVPLACEECKTSFSDGNAKSLSNNTNPNFAHMSN